MCDCKQYHYGDMNVVRECCVTECLVYHRQARRVAITEHHPCYQKAIELWNALTNTEMRRVMDQLESEGWIMLKSDDEATYGVPVGERMYPLIFRT